MFQDPFNVCMRFHVGGIKSCFCAYMFIFGNLLIQLKVILTFNDSNKDGWVVRVWISNSRLYCIDIREHTCGCNFSKGHSFNGETLGIHAVIFRPRGQVVSGGGIDKLSTRAENAERHTACVLCRRVSITWTVSVWLTLSCDTTQRGEQLWHLKWDVFVNTLGTEVLYS